MVEILDERIRIHYLNWSSQWDEWLSFTSPRIKQVISKPRAKVSRRKKSKRNSVSLKLITPTAEEKPVQKRKKRRSATQKSISLSLIGSRPEDYNMFYPNLEQASMKTNEKDEIDIDKPNEYRKQAQQEVEK